MYGLTHTTQKDEEQEKINGRIKKNTQSIIKNIKTPANKTELTG